MTTGEDSRVQQLLTKLETFATELHEGKTRTQMLQRQLIGIRAAVQQASSILSRGGTPGKEIQIMK
jgi:hypothetical protein